MHGVLRLGEAVMCVLGLARDLDEATAPQVGEVPGHQRLWQVEQLDQVTDTELAGGEQIQNSQPRRVGKAAEQRFEIRYDWRGNGRSHGVSSHMWEDELNLL